jgi:hypothetical protein
MSSSDHKRQKVILLYINDDHCTNDYGGESLKVSLFMLTHRGLNRGSIMTRVRYIARELNDYRWMYIKELNMFLDLFL